jgi:hypothetical protein
VTEYRFSDTYYSSQAFHENRESSDHLHEEGHRERILRVASWVNGLLATHGQDLYIVDFGCGNGGLLSQLTGTAMSGYDFCLANVKEAQALGRPVAFRNFVADPPESCDIAVMSEVLEHMDDPHAFLGGLDTMYLVASVPCGETPESHYEYHLWGWDMEGFAQALYRSGFDVRHHELLGSTQIVVAQRRPL